MLQLLHPVEGAACLEPLDLRLVEGVVQRDALLAPINVRDHSSQGLMRRDPEKEKDRERETEKDTDIERIRILCTTPVW